MCALDDEKIIELYWQRSEQAIPETEKKYGSYCRTIAVNILENSEDAEECVNDTWLKAWNAIPPARPERLSVFLGRMSRWLALARLRDQKRQKRGGGETLLALEELRGLLPGGEDTAAQLERKELTEALNRCLKRLGETERDVFVLRYWFLLPVGQIAARFGFSESKVKSMLYRSRQKMQKMLREEGWI